MKLLVLFALGVFASANAQNPQFNLINTSIWTSNLASEQDPNDTVFAKIRFSIEAVDRDIWFWRYSHETLDMPPNNGIWWSIVNASTGEATLTHASISTLARISGGGTEGNAWYVLDGTTATYEISVYFQPSTAGTYWFETDRMLIADSFGQLGMANGANPVETSNLRTDAHFANVVPEPSTAVSLVGGLGLLGLMRRRRK